MGRFLYKAMYNDQWGEHEIDHVIIIPDFDPSEMVPNSEEVEEVAVVTSEQLKEMLNGSYWFTTVLSLACFVQLIIETYIAINKCCLLL